MSNLTSREIVRRAIRFENPPRIPYNFDSNRTPADNIEYGEDMIWVFPKPKLGIHGKNEWSVGYEKIGETFGEPKIFPLEGKETLEGYTFPDFTEEWRYSDMISEIKKNKGEKYVLGMTPNGIFQHMIDLFGFQDFLVNVAINPHLVEEVCDFFCSSNIKVASIMAELGVDGVITMDDSALQDRPMISMDSFNKIFKPRFKKFYDHCHSLGLDTFIHTCGYTIDIIEELIDAGADVVNLDQQDNMGIWELSKRYKGRVCFYCPLDIQRTLELDENGITERVNEMIKAFMTDKGGFIAKTYPQPRAVGMSDNYLRIMTNAFKNYK